MNNRHYTIFSILLLFFLSLLIMLRQLISTAYFSCHIEDANAYVSWAWQFTEALKEGIIYPRWTPLNFWGYGGPTFVFYPPLAIYITAFFHIFTGSVITAMNITKFTSLFLSGIGIFFLVKEFYSEKVALLTASFYIIFPYQIFQFYYVGTFASVVSFMWFAPVILFTYRYIKDRHYKDIMYAGLCYGGLILTHLVNAYMFTFVLVAFILYMSIVTRKTKVVVLMPLITLIGLLISAAYILPVLFEKQFVHMKVFAGEGRESSFLFDFRNFFILPNMTSKFLQGHLWPEYYSTFVFYVILFCILISLSIIQMFKLRNIETTKNVIPVNRFFIGMAICTIFLLFGISAFLWEIIPFFKYVQFAHRWLNITTFAVVFSSSVMFWVYGNVYRKRRHYLFILLLFLTCFLLDYKYISSAHYLTEKELMPIKAANWYVFWLPVWVDIEKIDKNNDSKEMVSIMKGEGRVEVVARKSSEKIVDITAKKSLTVRIRTFNFPGWKAYIDGKQTEIKTEEDVGAMLINIPDGKHTLELRFTDTPIRYYSKIISVVSLCMVIFLAFFTKKTDHG